MFPNKDKIYQAVNWCINKLPETLNLAAINVLFNDINHITFLCTKEKKR